MRRQRNLMKIQISRNKFKTMATRFLIFLENSDINLAKNLQMLIPLDDSLCIAVDILVQLN